MSNNKKRTMKIFETTAEALKDLGKKGETYDDILQRLIQKFACEDCGFKEDCKPSSPEEMKKN